MKWMGGWSCDDYDSASPEIVDEIKALINEEAEEIERIRTSRG